MKNTNLFKVCKKEKKQLSENNRNLGLFLLFSKNICQRIHFI